MNKIGWASNVQPVTNNWISNTPQSTSTTTTIWMGATPVGSTSQASNSVEAGAFVNLQQQLTDLRIQESQMQSQLSFLQNEIQRESLQSSQEHQNARIGLRQQSETLQREQSDLRRDLQFWQSQGRLADEVFRNQRAQELENQIFKQQNRVSELQGQIRTQRQD